MQEVITLDAPQSGRRSKLWPLARACAPTRVECALAVISAALIILSFPDFDLWPLAWVGLVPLFFAVARRPRAAQAFLMGWLAGTLYLYGSCYWLTYPMINYGGLPAWLAYALLAPGAIIVGLFPAVCCLTLARSCARWGLRALAVAPFAWAALEWLRLCVTGQLWNAIGYSQAYVPAVIQVARAGGVYAVGFLLVTVNAALVYLILKRSVRSLAAASLVVAAAALTIFLFDRTNPAPTQEGAPPPAAFVVAVQPNVIPDFGRSAAEMNALFDRHLLLSARALRGLEDIQTGAPAATAAASVGAGSSGVHAVSQGLSTLPRIVVWPESPMNFAYARDAQFRATVTDFARRNRASVLFNSLEPAAAGGGHNSAVMVNEEGRLIAQYDKIRLLPFGEYVPLPRWLPGAHMVQAIVGEFTPGTEYPLMPLGEARAGVFICFESAFPSVARRFTHEGADVLINVSNDAYQGPTAVMRQHLANAVFRAVENGRHVLRVTNTGITAHISPRGEIIDSTAIYRPDARTWAVARAASGETFYTRQGDFFAVLCAVLSALALLATFRTFGRRPAKDSLK